jgi:polar amino acid transport system permease protein
MDRLLQYVDPAYVWEYREMLLHGLGVTLGLSVLTFCLAIIPGLLFALGRRLGPRWLALVLTGIVNVFRSVPTVLTVVFVYLALPFAGITLSPFVSVLVSLTVMQIVYFSEVFRGGLAAVGKVTPTTDPVPSRPGTMAFFVGGAWHRLVAVLHHQPP